MQLLDYLPLNTGLLLFCFCCGSPSGAGQGGTPASPALLETAVITTKGACREQFLGPPITALDVETAFLEAVLQDKSKHAPLVRGPSSPRGILVASTAMRRFPTRYRFLRVKDSEQADDVFAEDRKATLWNLYIDYDAFQEDGDDTWEVVAGYAENGGGGIGDNWSISYRLGRLATGQPCFAIGDLVQP